MYNCIMFDKKDSQFTNIKWLVCSTNPKDGRLHVSRILVRDGIGYGTDGIQMTKCEIDLNDGWYRVVKHNSKEVIIEHEPELCVNVDLIGVWNDLVDKTGNSRIVELVGDNETDIMGFCYDIGKYNCRLNIHRVTKLVKICSILLVAYVNGKNEPVLLSTIGFDCFIMPIHTI